MCASSLHRLYVCRQLSCHHRAFTHSQLQHSVFSDSTCSLWWCFCNLASEQSASHIEIISLLYRPVVWIPGRQWHQGPYMYRKVFVDIASQASRPARNWDPARLHQSGHDLLCSEPQGWHFVVILELGMYCRGCVPSLMLLSQKAQ